MNFTNANNGDMKFKDMKNQQFLVYDTFKEFEQVEGICYVLSVSNALSAIGSNFYRLIVRTVDGKNVPCVVFETDKISDLGFKLNSLKNKYIKLKATVSLYDGRYSLRFLGITVHNDITPDLVLKFKKVVENVDSYYEDLNTQFGNFVEEKFPQLAKSQSYPNLYKGDVGGFVKLSWDMMVNCQSVMMDLPYDNFMKVLFYSLVYYKQYLDKYNELNVMTDSDKITFISNIDASDYDGRLIRESVCGLIELTKPSHIIPVVIYKTYNNIMSMQNIKNNWEMLMAGGVSECEGFNLLKY